MNVKLSYIQLLQLLGDTKLSSLIQYSNTIITTIKITFLVTKICSVFTIY